LSHHQPSSFSLTLYHQSTTNELNDYLHNTKSERRLSTKLC
jgi:hypothetical protein